MRQIYIWIFIVLLASTASAGPAGSVPSSVTENLLTRLHQSAPELDAMVLSLALDARDCAIRSGTAPDAQRIAVIDYSRPSTERRLWVFDVAEARLLHAEYVAHGRNSGGNFATAFSNRDGSHQSSLGLFETTNTYIGGNGYSLRMAGLEPGVNDKAMSRAIVMHGARYVDPILGERQGRLGRSFGCPALRPVIAREVIDTLKGGQLLFAYYPDQEWLAQSRFLACRGNTIAVH